MVSYNLSLSAHLSFCCFRGLNEAGYFPYDLYEIRQEIIDNDSCYLSWGGDITDRMLCAAVENEVDSCSGKLIFKLSIYIVHNYFFFFIVAT